MVPIQNFMCFGGINVYLIMLAVVRVNNTGKNKEHIVSKHFKSVIQEQIPENTHIDPEKSFVKFVCKERIITA